jgi:hypothetical protein
MEEFYGWETCLVTNNVFKGSFEEGEAHLDWI